MLAAKTLCDSGDLDFEHLFARQYCLSRQTLPRISGWKSPRRLKGWGLTHCAKLDHAELKDNTGELVGWFLGTAVDQAGQLIGKQAHRFGAASTDKDFWNVVEREVSDFAGRYIVCVITDSGKRVYFDPVMDLPAVYNRKEETVASSPLMALSRPVRTNHRIRQNLILKKGGNYGMQQTCDPDVSRALSNHYLDLESFSLHRHWPDENDSFEETAENLDDVADRMVARLGQITGALLENHSCLLALSGGADSRTLAYSAREKLHLAQMTYSHRTTWISQYDCYVGKLVADDLGLGGEFQIFDAMKEIKDGTYDQSDQRRLRWDFCHRTGYQNAPKNAVLVLGDILPETDYILRGNIMDMARANQWPKSFKFDLNHGISKLVLGGRSADENLAYWGPEYLNWVDTLPASARSRIYDFAFLEQLLPNTLGGRLIGYANANYINPFNDRHLIQACIQVDPATRGSGQLNEALHRACGVGNLPMTGQVRADETAKAEAEKLFS